jgi:hypothetical protein
MVKLAHARISEKGTIEGVAGDQTGHEVEVSDWYSGGWLAVYRPNNETDAAIIARTAEAACRNNNVGYSQEDRLSLYSAAVNCLFDLDKISTPVNTDCSALVAVCVIAAGISITKHMNTRSEDTTLMGTGKFTRLQGSRYLTTPDYLKRGDILRKQGHTAIVVSDGSKAYEAGENVKNRTVIYADYLQKEKAGKYRATTDVYMREGASVSYRAMCVVYEDNPVYCYGYYSMDDRGVVWLYCEYALNHIVYTGFVSSNCLVREGDI